MSTTVAAPSTAAAYFATVIQPLRTEAFALLGARPIEATARRIHECGINSYVGSHCEARDYSLEYGVTCYVVRRAQSDVTATFHPFTHVQVVQAGMEVLAVYVEGARFEESEAPAAFESGEPTEAEREAMEVQYQAEIDAEYDAYPSDFEEEEAPILISLPLGVRLPYLMTPGASYNAYLLGLREMFGACREAGLPTDGEGREVMLCALRAFFQDERITSRTMLYPAKMAAATLAIQSGRLRWEVQREALAA